MVLRLASSLAAVKTKIDSRVYLKGSTNLALSLTVAEKVPLLGGRKPAHCPGPTSFNVACCGQPTNEAVKAVAAYRPGLTSLNVACCGQPTDEAVKAVAAHCRRTANVGVLPPADLD
jgi:hypothetical protein